MTRSSVGALWRRTLVRRLLGSLLVSFALVEVGLLTFEVVDFERHPGDHLGIQRHVNLDVEVLAHLPDERTAALVARTTVERINANRRRAAELPGELLSQLRRQDGTVVFASAGLDGTVLDGNPGEVVVREVGGRAYWVAQAHAGGLTLSLAEPRADAIVVRDFGEMLAVRIAIAFPLVLLPLWIAVATGMRPLRRLGDLIGARRHGDLSPFVLALPYEELTPLVSAFDSLLARLRHHVEREHVFIQNAAHELRTPMAIVAAHSEVLVGALDDDQRRQAKAALDVALARMSHLSQQLLELASLDPGVTVVTERVDVAGIVQKAMAAAALGAVSSGIDLSLEAPETLPFVLERAAFESMLGNLLDNALKYVPAQGRVVVLLEGAGGGLTLTVADSGPGIPVAWREKIFERFWRSADLKVPGTGLGLAIVRQAVERLGGRIDVEDGLDGRGVAFKVTIARSMRAEDPHAPGKETWKRIPFRERARDTGV